MDHGEMSELDQLLTETRASALASLTGFVDVEHQLEIIRRACAFDDPESPTAPLTTTP